jgi:opacity protein-like surface antigen
MKLLAILLLLVPLGAQEPAKPPDQAAAPAAPAPPPAAAPSGENWLEGSIEVGYRWIPNIDGNFNAYRSVVNLGQGPKLFDADFTLLNPSKRLFDRADVHATGWGGDPYNTLRVDVQKDKAYRLLVDYRNTAYFNFLPSYADPTLSQGALLNQNSFDTAIRTLNVQLDLLPNKWITPYVGFGRNTQFGSGITVFQTDQNEYPVASLYSDQTNTYRAGVRMELGRYHINIEEGGTTFKDDQGASDNLPNPGNFSGLFLGQQLSLSQMQELYRVRGDSVYTKVLGAANPYSWLSVTGQFVYSRPHTDISYTETSAGNFFLNDIFQFYSAGQDVLTGYANMPHTSGSVTVELRPWRHVRIVEYWNTERYRNASSALLAQTLLVGGSPLTDQQLATDRLNLNYNQEEIDVFYDVTSRLTIRGGYRYVWGDTDLGAPILSGLSLESANLRRHVGIAGINYRFSQKLRVSADAEGSSSDQTFFRTSLQQYQKAHIRASYDLMSSLHLGGDFSLLNNSNPDPSVKLDFRSKVESVSLFWTPNGGKWTNLLLDYSRSAVQSNILYLVPQILLPEPSIYKENAHALTAVVSVKWFSFGGSLFISSGSRPTRYYQPLARLSIPLNKHVRWNTEWRYYSMAETFYAFEDFRSNQLMTSLRFTK